MKSWTEKSQISLNMTEILPLHLGGGHLFVIYLLCVSQVIDDPHPEASY